MSTGAVTPLRHRMIEDMNARKLCAGTQRGHIHSCKRFAGFLNRSPDTATTEDIRRFQLHLAEAGVSICNRNRIMTGLRFLFRVTLRRLDLAAEIYHIREPHKIPLVEGAPIALRRRSTGGGALAVSRQQARQADDHPPVEPTVSPGGRRGRDQESRDAARVAPQLRHPPARARHRHQNYPGVARS